ncbi:MAG TPA: hypothetical protein VK324_17625 [Tepidisphaeraceae bacterium]|nr:hypothetical protein [Tepidisphaeraceae bacterium]
MPRPCSTAAAALLFPLIPLFGFSTAPACAQAPADEVVPAPTTRAVDDVSDVFQLVVRHRFLGIETKLPVTEKPQSFHVPGLLGPAEAQLSEVGARGVEKFNFVVGSNDAAGESMTTVTAAPGYLGIFADHATADETSRRSIQYLQRVPLLGQSPEVDDPPVKLYVDVNEPATGLPATKLQLTATDFVDLRERYPRETARFLMPVLAQLQQEATVLAPDPALAWQVFADQRQTDDATRAAVEALVARLGADRATDRAAAAAELKEMGPKGAVALMRLDRSALSAEQNTRIDELLAPFQPADPARTLALAADADFLVDCLYLDDPALRTAAVARLSEIAGRPVKFDITARGRARSEAVEQVRQSLHRDGAQTPATPPATAPAPVAPPPQK